MENDTVEISITCPICNNCIKIESNVDTLKEAIQNIYCYKERTNGKFIEEKDRVHLPCCCYKQH